MNEVEYLKALAREVRLNKNERLNSILTWCEMTQMQIMACDGDEMQQRDHAAATASVLLMEANRLEEEGVSDPHVSYTPFSQSDRWAIIYTFALNVENKTITIEASTVDGQFLTKIEGHQFESLVLSVRDGAIIEVSKDPA